MKLFKKLDIKKTLEAASVIAAVVVLYGIFGLVGIGCPIKFITGISCAGCGMTRAWLSLLHGDFTGAYYYHPLFLLPAVVVLLILNRNRINSKLYKGSLALIVVIFLVVYVARMLSPTDSIVVFQPENGFVGRHIRRLYETIKIFFN